MKKYFANMNVNNGTRYITNLQGSNFRKLAREISASARANCFIHNEFSWTVWDENGIIVAAGAGRITAKGCIYYSCSDYIGRRM